MTTLHCHNIFCANWDRYECYRPYTGPVPHLD